MLDANLQEQQYPADYRKDAGSHPCSTLAR